MLTLRNVTLLGLDCVDLERLKIARDICIKDIKFGAVKLLTSIESNDEDVVKIDRIGSIEAYSEFMLKKVNDYVDTEFVLIFQHDGFVLNARSWNDEFLNYDYIGAPWWYMDSNNVGNGGFSLRSKKLLTLLQNDAHIETIKDPAEDHVICRIYGDYLKEKGVSFAPESLASTFSIEGDVSLPVKYGSIWKDEFGFHDLKNTDISKWLNQNVEYKDLIKLVN
ncbi:MAG: DUF5672 family protein [Minisyncoccia bacterium]